MHWLGCSAISSTPIVYRPSSRFRVWKSILAKVRGEGVISPERAGAKARNGCM